MPTNLYGPNDNFSETKSHVIPGLMARMHKAKIERKINSIYGALESLCENFYMLMI